VQYTVHSAAEAAAGKTKTAKGKFAYVQDFEIRQCDV
jgi:hypothetical protein